MNKFLTEDMAKDEQEQMRIKAVFDKMGKSSWKRFWYTKRIFDAVVAFIGLIVIALPMLVIALIIYIDDPSAGPIYSQNRIGRHGKIFRLYKFRTMVANADEIKKDLEKFNEMEGPAFKMKDDPRITRIGRFLRKVSLDELPQLFNVIKGDMSIVGPRPPIPGEVENYNKYQMLRLTVTPGLTCLWQIQPNRNDISFDDWVDLDVEYILGRSWRLDFEIMFKTAFVMFKGEGR